MQNNNILTFFGIGVFIDGHKYVISTFRVSISAEVKK